MRNTKSAFTLVELIVVITILAILGTIAFISLQGYSADARNSKRTSDIGNIQSAMSLKMVEGVPVMSFITSDPLNKITAFTTAGIGWTAPAAGEYEAGTPSYSVLNVAAKDFKDPNDKAYRIGATTLKAGAFQVAATMEVDWTPTAQVNGTYVARLAATTYTGTIDGKTLTVGAAAANYFKVGDTVNLTTGTAQSGLEIQKVSRDGVTITFWTGVTASTIALAQDEIGGLIGASVFKTPSVSLSPVTNLSTTALAY